MAMLQSSSDEIFFLITLPSAKGGCRRGNERTNDQRQRAKQGRRDCRLARLIRGYLCGRLGIVNPLKHGINTRLGICVG